MSNEYTLHYFELHGRGDPIRVLLNHAEVQFEDKRYNFDNWGAVKPTMPNQQIPCLELPGGKKMGQSMAILRFVGMKHGYYPTDLLEAHKADELCDGYSDVGGKVYKPHFMPEGAEKDAFIKEIFEKILPPFLKVAEAQCSLGKEFLVSDKLCTADFFIGGLYTNYVNNDSISFAKDQWRSCLDDYPNFKAYCVRYAAANEKWISSRPSAAI